MAEAVYMLCAITCAICAALLVRGYRATRTELLLWSSLCFVGLAINNILLFIDLVVVPTVDLSVLRNTVALVAMLVLLYGLIWESQNGGAE
ncbi:MAG: DUF5985 family protein [Polyangiaceae bacterium]